ncbi:MAG: hypothetical protein ACRDZ3_11005 [Acidimicrobiia bacterium]
MRRPSLALAFLLTAAALVGVVRPAGACTCQTFDTRQALATSDAAFVGALVSRIDPVPAVEGAQAAPDTIYRFRVDEVVKGDLGPEVDVHSEGSASDCGLSVTDERPLGLLLTERDDGALHATLCSRTTPERLARAAEPVTPPDGRLPPAILVGSTYGNARSVALDGDGRVAALGSGPGATDAVALCPGRERVVELFTAPGADGTPVRGITVRLLATMATESERLLPELGPGNPEHEALACRDEAATDIVLSAPYTRAEGDDPYNPTRWYQRLVRVAPGQPVTTLWEGPDVRSIAIGPGGHVAYLNAGPAGEHLIALTLDGPAVARAVAEVPAGSGPMVASPDGRRLATVAVGLSRPSQVVSVDLASTPAVVSTSQLGGAGVAGDVQWVGDNLVFMPALRPAEPVRIFDPDLTLLASWAGWTAEHSIVVGDRLWGASQGAVRSAPLTTGPASVVRELEDALVIAIADVTPAVTEPAPVTTTTTTAPPVSSTTTTTVRPAPTTTTTTEPEPTTTTSTPPEPPSEEPTEVAGRTTTRGGGSAGGLVALIGAVVMLLGTAVGLRARRQEP